MHTNNYVLLPHEYPGTRIFVFQIENAPLVEFMYPLVSRIRQVRVTVGKLALCCICATSGANELPSLLIFNDHNDISMLQFGTKIYGCI